MVSNTFEDSGYLIEIDVLSLTAHKGSVVRLTPTMVLINDPTKLPEIYHRQADKGKHYITGSFGKAESAFNMQNWRQHAQFRRVIAGPVCHLEMVFERFQDGCLSVN